MLLRRVFLNRRKSTEKSSGTYGNRVSTSPLGYHQGTHRTRIEKRDKHRNILEIPFQTAIRVLWSLLGHLAG